MNTKLKEKQNILHGWQQVVLGDLVSVTTGKRDANHGSPDGRYPFFTCAQTVSKIDDFSFDTEAVLIAGNGDFNVKYYKGKFDAYQRTYVLSDFKNTTGPFVYQKTIQALDDIMKNNQGSSVKFIKMGDLTEYEFSLPPIKEQQKIAEILGAVDEDIAKTQEVIEATEKLKRGLMQQLFTRGIGHTKFKETESVEIPEGWEVRKISDIAKLISERNENDAVRDVVSVTKYRGIVSSLEYFNKQVYSKNLKTYKIIKKGQFAYATIHLDEGSIGYLDIYDVAILSPMYTVFEINQNLIDTKYLFNLLKSHELMSIYKNLGEGSVDRRKSISFENFSSIEIIIPPLREQQEITKVIEVVDEKILVNKKLKEKLTLLKKGLMQDLLSGKVRTIIN